MENSLNQMELVDIQTKTGLQLGGRKAVVDSVENRVVGVVSARYKLVQNKTLLDIITPVVEKLDLGFDTPIIKTSRGGAVTFFKFLGQKIQGEIQKGDIVRFGIEFFNSYDCSMQVGFHLVAERLVCINGLVVPKSITSIEIRHFGKRNVMDTISNKLYNFTDKVLQAISLWKKWTQNYPEVSVVNNFLKNNVGDKLGTQIGQQFNILPTNRKNLWELYNLFTYSYTHQLKTRKEDVKILRQFERTEYITNRMTNYFGKELITEGRKI